MQDLMLDTHKKICFGTNNEAPRQLGFKRDLMKFILQSGGGGGECSVLKGNKI